MTKFRKGDIVSAIGVVHRTVGISDNDVTVVFGGRVHSPEYLNPEVLTLVTPVLEVGDAVRGLKEEGGIVIATILAIHDGNLWVERPGGGRDGRNRQFIWKASEVNRMDDYIKAPANGEEPPAVAPVQPPSANEPGF